MKSVMIDGVKYVEQVSPSEMKIVVLDRGFVVVGTVTQNGNLIVIDNCSCVRRWGTTKGLGELASKGPLKDTILDPQPRTIVHELQIIQMIDCEVTAWKQ